MIRDRKQIRKWRTAKNIKGGLGRPRLSVAITLKNIYAQIIDDSGGKTLAYVSTMGKDFRSLEQRDNTAAARAVGSALAKEALSKGLTEVVLDRGSRRYHGRVRALAEAAREGGLKF